MTFNATILADSVTASGQRLTTIEATFPRLVLAEVNTHRALSRNSASSRAIPVEKMIARAIEAPFIPEQFGRNQAGMQAAACLDAGEHTEAVAAWLRGRDKAVTTARELLALGAHKQLANRVLEPYLWHTAIITATDWGNFFGLRCHPDAQPEIQRVAVLMREAMAASTPTLVDRGWHLPLVPDYAELRADGFSVESIAHISAGRCARVSYLTHHGQRDPHADLALCERLIASGHLSPLEHVATPCTGRHGNLREWQALRCAIPCEADFSQRD